MKKDINFHKFFKKANLISFVLFTLSSLIIFFKGLNYGVDFKGGTLLEIQINEKNINISDIRSSLNNINLGDVKIKEFGEKGNYLIKIEAKTDLINSSKSAGNKTKYAITDEPQITDNNAGNKRLILLL